MQRRTLLTIVVLLVPLASLLAWRPTITSTARVADQPNASPQALEFASEAFARIEPAELRNGERSLKYAERFARLKPAGDPVALYILAFAQNAEGGSQEATQTAHRALALLAPSRGGGNYYIRTELESIH